MGNFGKHQIIMLREKDALYVPKITLDTYKKKKLKNAVKSLLIKLIQYIIINMIIQKLNT